MNSTSHNGWSRAIAWGNNFQACNKTLDCYDALNATRQNQVLDYVCKKVADYADSRVCLCATRQLKIGVNCDQLTTFSYVALGLKFLNLSFVLYVFAKGVRAVWLCRGRWNPALVALIIATIHSAAVIVWVSGMIIRIADVLGNSSAIPIVCVTLVMEHGVIMIAWERLTARFNQATKSMQKALDWFERGMKFYLVLMPLMVLYFNIQKQYSKTSLITAISLLLFTIGFVLVGIKLHGILAESASSDIGSGSVSSNPSVSAKLLAIKCIRVYTMWIALGNFLAVLSMVFFTVADALAVRSRADNMFHLDVIAVQLIPLATCNCSRNITNYILASQNRTSTDKTGSKTPKRKITKQTVTVV